MATEHILMIVESPNKVQTLKSFLPSNYTVVASVGHITHIADSGKFNMGIDVDNNFTPDIKADPNKRDVIKLLKENAKLADKIILATDPDREGECIAYMLKKILKIADSKYERVTFHEITKTAVLNALKNPRKIDDNMASAAITRSVLDKIIGYRISPIVLTKCSSRSAGRVQSAALKILALREDEINNFNAETFYELWLPFIKSKIEYRAQYKGTDTKKIVSLPNKETAEKIIDECKNNDYILKKIDAKERSIKSNLPFTTSTFQQAASAKLGYQPKAAMQYAQKLFEGINLNGNHIALITYIRTDSTTMSEDFAKDLEKFVKTNYGSKYFAPLKKPKKEAKNVQDGHECLRAIDLDMTPEKLKTLISDSHLVNIYKLIYNRTVAAAMSDCIMEDTEFSIYNGKHRFAYSIHKVKFDGFKKVYSYKDDDDNDEKYPTLKIDEKLKTKKLDLIEKKTNPPSRYTEAKLVAELESKGIGRPSTFASTITTITDPERGYTEKDGKTIKVTDKGMRLSKFLDNAFPDVINLNYTALMEDSLDKISQGNLNNVSFLKEFYDKLCAEISLAKKLESNKPDAELVGRKCPKCGKELVYRMGRYGRFIACSGFAGKKGCDYTERIQSAVSSTDNNKPKATPTGYKCPECGSEIVIRINSKTNQPFYACSGFPKHKKIFTELEFKKIVEKQSIDSKSSDKS